MATAPPGEEAAPFGKVKVKVQAEFWIDPLDHVPLAERRAMIFAGGQRGSPGNFPMCGVDSALGQVTSRLLLEVFISELARALKPLSMHCHRAQIVTESSSQYNLKDGAVAVNSEPAQMSSHMAVNFEDGCSFEDWRSEDSQRNVCERSHIVPCFGLKVKGCSSSSGQRDAGVGCDDMVLSSPDLFIKVKVEPPDASIHRGACIPHERTTEAEQEEIDHVLLHERCKSSPFSSIAGGCSQVDVSREPNPFYSSFAGARNVTTTQGRRTPISSSQAAYEEDLSSHAQAFSYLENITREHGADELNGGDNNFEMEFPLKKYVVNSSEGNATEHVCTSVNDIPESSIASFPCMGVKLSSTCVNNDYHVSLEESNFQRDERCDDVNLDRAGGAGNIAAVTGLQEQSSLKANKLLSDSSLSTDPVRMKHKFSDRYCLSEESAAKRICTSISVYPESCTRKGVNEVLSDAYMDNFSSGTGNLAEKEGQTGQKEKQLKTDCLLRSSSLSTSIVTVKVELADEAADDQLSEADALKESCMLHPSPNTQATWEASVCRDNISFVVHNLQENHEHGGTCPEGTSINHFNEPLVSNRERNFGVVSQPCVSPLSLPHFGVKVEATEENSHNQVLAANAANSLCGSVLGSQEGTAIRSMGDLSVQNCYDQAPEANDSNRVYTSVFDSQENSLPVCPCTVAEVLSKDISYEQSISSANNLQESQQCTMFTYRMPEDASVAVKGKNCSNIDNQGLDGTFLLSPGRVKVEQLEELCAVCSSETATATKFITSTFDSSNKFEADHCRTTLCGTRDMQTIREGGTMCADNMSANLPVGSNLRDVLPDSTLSASPKMVKIESLEGNHVGCVSETETTVNFISSAFESSDWAVGMNACAGTPVREDQQIRCDMTDLLPDSTLSTFPVRVKDEPQDHVFCDSESMTRKDSSLSTFNSPIHAVGLNPLPDILYSSKAINFQVDSPSRVSNVQNNQETIVSSSQINIPEDTGVVTRLEQACMTNHCIGLDVPASQGIDTVKQLEERCANIVHEDTPGSLNGSYLSSNLMPKLEPVESSIQNLCINPLGIFLNFDRPLVEAKRVIDDEPSVDMLDHMPLTERTKMLASSMASELKPARKSRCFKHTQVHAVGCDSVGSLKVKTKSSTHRRKRKKTATDSVETALEEDAPGLLQGLLDRGIDLEEIKLYGCEEDVDALDISPHIDSFEDLEDVISKLFSEQPTSLFKLAPLRAAKGTKAVYCLACLISLIEQTRYLRFRNRPVEWGWCRDLQSFIFIFKMHNRIVLERPEYGYATYFFELVESFPVDWQIKRLVTAMKLTSCSRATLIENKSLLVGEDLSEGEARVLEEYGWRPNTGLGSMLNYCDRVVHDRRERDTSDWRLKIGKLLMDGYDGGRIVKADLPKKVVDYVGNHYPEIKMET